MRGGPPAWGLGEVLTMPPHEKTLLRNIHKARCFLWRQNNLEANYSPNRLSPGNSVSRGGIAQQEKGHGMLGAYTEQAHLRQQPGN